MATYLEQSLAKLEEFEGSIPWMYRDTVGKVTVGVGMMLPDVAAATRLPFALAGRSATEEEIAAEFARVDALPMGRPALFYYAPDKPELAQAEIDSLLCTVLTGFEGELRTALAGYDRFPDGVKMALLDMAYNLGPAGLLHGYPRMLKAVEAGNWAQAAANCERVGPGAARNNWTRQMFLENVVSSIKAEGEHVLKQVGYGLVGITASLWTKLRKR
jgi:GH24 family phage-related lysozyme (muramidase)